jgi:hypothetical protein
MKEEINSSPIVSCPLHINITSYLNVTELVVPATTLSYPGTSQSFALISPLW